MDVCILPSQTRPMNLPHLYLAHPVEVSQRFLVSENYSPWAIVWHCFYDPKSSDLCTTTTGDRRTDTWWQHIPR